MGRARRCVLGRRDLAGLYILLSGCVFNGITWVLCGSGGGRLIFFGFCGLGLDPSRAFNYIIFFLCGAVRFAHNTPATVVCACFVCVSSRARPQSPRSGGPCGPLFSGLAMAGVVHPVTQPTQHCEACSGCYTRSDRPAGAVSGIGVARHHRCP